MKGGSDCALYLVWQERIEVAERLALGSVHCWYSQQLQNIQHDQTFLKQFSRTDLWLSSGWQGMEAFGDGDSYVGIKEMTMDMKVISWWTRGCFHELKYCFLRCLAVSWWVVFTASSFSMKRTWITLQETQQWTKLQLRYEFSHVMEICNVLSSSSLEYS